MTNCTFCPFCAGYPQRKRDNREVGQYNHQFHTGQKQGLFGKQKCLPSTFQPALQTYTGSNLRADKPLCRPTPPISLVCQTRCNVFLPPKIIPTAYMESPRMGPNLPYKPATPNRKTSHTRTSQSRKTSHTRTSQSGKTNSRKVAKRAISVYLRTGKRATRVQRARLSFPL